MPSKLGMVGKGPVQITNPWGEMFRFYWQFDIVLSNTTFKYDKFLVALELKAELDAT